MKLYVTEFSAVQGLLAFTEIKKFQFYDKEVGI